MLQAARLGLIAGAAWLALGCGSEPSSSSASSASATGSGGMGGSGGIPQGEGPVAPLIESLTTDISVVTELPTTVIFSARVTDPQGFDDIEGGLLHQGNVQSPYGTFEAIDSEGGYQLALLIDESQPWPEMATAFVFLATFRDRDGNTGERSKAIQFDMGGCSQKPDHESCRACFCAADPAGCASYTAIEYHHLHCGNVCNQDCSAFCQSVYDGQPDPQLIDGLCNACQPSNRDIGAFQDACLADIPDCFGFLVDMGHCPP
jgi:hypothetical protein